MSVRSPGNGVPGPTGPIGVTGPAGPTGPTGSTGATGPQGLQGVQGVQGIQGIQGVQGATGSTGPTGPTGSPGLVPVYGPSGLISNPKIWVGTATTNSSGDWTCNYSSAGFMNVFSVQTQAVSTSNTAANSVSTSMTAPTTTSVSGAAYVAQAITLLGLLPLQFVGAGVVIQIVVIGN